MPRARQAFRQADITRAIKSARAAGVDVERVEIDLAGKIVIVAKTAGEPAPLDDFGKWKAGRDARQAQGN